MSLAEIETYLHCPYCKNDRLDSSESGFRCVNCNTDFPFKFNILNTLIRPDGEVLHELQAGMREAGMDGQPFENYIFRQTPRIAPMEERKVLTDEQKRDFGMPTGYYRMTEQNFEHAFRKLALTGSETVLEIGANFDLPFLSAFARLGCTCFATNIFFYTNEIQGAIDDRIARVVGDMNALPYRDELFDVIVFSATLHHTPALRETIAEIARVMKPGGVVLVLSEPVQGVLKNFWNVINPAQFSAKGRDEDIHEGEYSIFKYRSFLRENDIEILESFFSPFYDAQLRKGPGKDIRFAPVAKFISLFWKIDAVNALLKQRLLLPGQILLGLQANIIGRKRDTRPYIGETRLPKRARRRSKKASAHAGHAHAH